MNDLDLIKKIADEGLRVFTTNTVQKIAKGLGISESHTHKLIHKLKINGLLRQLYRGTYALPNTLLAGPPLHEYEIISHIEDPSAVCCWSAFYYHNLTDQIMNVYHILVPYRETAKNTSQYSYRVENTDYIVIRTKPSLFFGIEKQFQSISEASFYVTDLERTLIDGLVRPQYCGGFLEVINAFSLAASKINIKRLMEYAERYGLSIQKRMGWIFETLHIFPAETELLKSRPCSSSYRIDVSNKGGGEWIRAWNLQRNI